MQLVFSGTKHSAETWPIEEETGMEKDRVFIGYVLFQDYLSLKLRDHIIRQIYHQPAVTYAGYIIRNVLKKEKPEYIFIQ
jgi:hypothetical protein